MTQSLIPDNPQSSHIPCTDGFHRLRSVGLWTAPRYEQVVLVAPPAEAALLNPAQARKLGERLIELATVTEQQHAELLRAQRDLRPRLGVA